MGGCRIGSSGAIKLCDNLRTMNSAIQVLDLSFNHSLGDACMKSLGEFIKSSNCISHLYLSGSSVSDSGVEMLANLCCGNTSLKCLYLSGMIKVTDKSIPSLVRLIESTHIENLKVDNGAVTLLNTLCLPLAHNLLKYGSDSFSMTDV